MRRAEPATAQQFNLTVDNLPVTRIMFCGLDTAISMKINKYVVLVPGWTYAEIDNSWAMIPIRQTMVDGEINTIHR